MSNVCGARPGSELPVTTLAAGKAGGAAGGDLKHLAAEARLVCEALGERHALRPQ